jgi:tetratricopeptide (TPR) repeat protein
MEYIEGARNLIEYADAQHLGGSERLSLLGQVCDAVHHGHQKGVIHRDLKPANILVDTRSGMAQPKVIDFGVARATDSDLTVATLDTGVGQIIGTLRYMSPEQCDGDPRSVDIRSDVYALGVIAYELLTGTMPYDLSELSLASVARAIRELPAKPLSAISASLRGDTETLVLKALEKEPARRYQSAADMAADIRRLRAHEPLMARPASSVYLAKMFVRRHRTGVSAAAGVVAALVLGIVGFAVQAHRVAEQRDRAVKAGKRSDAVATFIRTTLQTSDPNRGGNQGMLVADSMMNAVAKLDAGEFKDEPEIDSSLRLTIAEILSGNGRLDEALALADRALGSIRKANPGDHRDVAKGLRITGGCLVSAGRFEAALPKLQEALEMDRRLSKDDHTDIATDLNDIGLCLESLGRHSEALPMLQAALEMNQRLHPGDHDDVSVNMNNMGLVLNSLGRREEALAQFQAALDMRQRLIKVDHPMIATGLANVGATLNLLGKPAEALPRLQGALEMSQRLYKGDHPTTANNMRHLAICLSKLDRLPEALDMAQQGAAMASRALPDGHPIRAACDRAVTNIKKKIDERSGTKTPKPGG